MRAILLQKDKEGLNEERLKGRYGLTGKATISKEGVAGALATSFKAGQQVTINNLRSLGNKINEAQKALNNATNNINETEKRQDDIEDTVNKINELLNVGIWERLWKGSCSPFEFFSAKYQEDLQNENMAGEPYHSVIGINKNRTTAPLPRTPYWDPLLVYGEFSDTNVDTSFRLIPSHILDKFNDEDSSLSAKFYSTVGIIGSAASAMTSACFVNPTLLAAYHVIPYFLTAAAGLLTTVYGLTSRLKRYHNNFTTEALIVRGYSGNFPVMFRSGIFGQITYLYYSLINSQLNELLILAISASVTAGAVLGLTIAGAGLMSNPYTFVVGLALQTAAVSVAVSTNPLNFQLFLKITMTEFACATYQTTVTTCNMHTNFDVDDNLINKILGLGFLSQASRGFEDKYSPLFKKDISIENGDYVNETKIESNFSEQNGNKSYSLIAGYPGLSYQFDQTDISSVISEISMGITTVNSIFSIVNLITSLADGYKFPDVSGIPMATTKIANDCSEVRLGNSNKSDDNLTWPLQDWFGLSKIDISESINDIITGSINNITFPAGNVMCSEIRMCAEVYTGNYFGKKWFTRRIDRTIIIKSKAEIYQNADSQSGLWYGCMALVRFAGETKLCLLWERNALYFKNYHIRHIEQMIYNIPMNSAELPASKMFTEDRRGQLQYFYVEDQPGDGQTYHIQFRPIKNQVTNYLNNKPLNTEYTFDGNVNLTTAPMNGQFEGGVYSYCSAG